MLAVRKFNGKVFPTSLKSFRKIWEGLTMPVIDVMRVSL